MPEAHKIEFLKNGTIRCSCQWFFRIKGVDQWGSKAQQDELLDRYNEHVKPIPFNKLWDGKERRRSEES